MERRGMFRQRLLDTHAIQSCENALRDDVAGGKNTQFQVTKCKRELEISKPRPLFSDQKTERGNVE